ncbi:hypothetical protein LZ575_19975 [Antarcticibacterium sp. 1MA-6-2]|uniref:hypothetical protein n=1 Tax=Antarcticibacterium sp. 1MA-6-2 TaxID=2908210 RepID=UPI001F1F4B66|nr:hypothetical protein [Antarcticibacterium sp. 1MA-6-2]UJH90941.1 hypothetical protein LZ575_19975 [Antarcticibacterium sp. 1MA-6-2]
MFNDYLQGQLELTEFIERLRTIEDMHKQAVNDTDSDSGLWFKFSEDDTIVSTINDLERDLADSNRNYTLKRMREALNLDQELSVHYS